MKLFTSITLALLLISNYAYGQVDDYPARPIKVISPNAAGSGGDLTLRVLLEAITKESNVSFTVDNRPGGDGIIGAVAAAKAPADGYTLFFGNNATHAGTPALHRELAYSPGGDFAPIVLVHKAGVVLAAKSDSSLKSYGDVLAAARRNDPPLRVAVTSVTTRVALEGLMSAAAMDLSVVPYKTANTAFVDLLGGRIDLAMETLAATMPLIRRGELRGLGVPSEKRMRSLPDTPTFEEMGAPDTSITSWTALFALKGTSPAIIHRINTWVNHALLSDDVQNFLKTVDSESVGGTPEQAATFIASERVKWQNITQRAGMKAE